MFSLPLGESGPVWTPEIPMKLMKTLAAVLLSLPLAWSAVALADDGRERERKYEQWAREDAKRHDEWIREEAKREAEYRRERSKDEREHAREASKAAQEYWRERDKVEAKAYRKWLKERVGDDRDYRRAYDHVERIGRVIVGPLRYED